MKRAFIVFRKCNRENWFCNFDNFSLVLDVFKLSILLKRIDSVRVYSIHNKISIVSSKISPICCFAHNFLLNEWNFDLVTQQYTAKEHVYFALTFKT